MLLAIDVGNTNIVLGVFDGATLVQSWRLQTLRERTSDELGLLVDGLFAHSRIDAADSRRHPRLGRAAADRHDRAMVERYFGVKALVVEPASTPACRSSTRTRPRSAPIGSSTASPRGSATAATPGGR
jgi:type III pantothenate kinase